MKKRICILYYNAGAGHRSVATALYNELSSKPELEVSLVNFIEKYQVTGFNKASQSYSFSLKYFSAFYGLIVKLVDTLPVLTAIRFIYKQNANKYFQKFMQDYPADIYISNCYYDNELFDYIKAKNPKTKTIMLVTDIVYALRIWFNDKRDLILVPTQELYNNGFKYFNKYSKKVKIVGLPIAKEYFAKHDVSNLKQQLGLKDKQTILVSAGGEGISNIFEIVSVLDKHFHNLNICVICGKNTNLLQKLRAKSFNNNVKPFGWTDDFAKLLIVADLFLTKAGATSIWEAITLNKKTIAFDLIKGQEEGNIEFAKKFINIEYVPDINNLAASTNEMLKLVHNKRKQEFNSNAAQVIYKLLFN